MIVCLSCRYFSQPLSIMGQNNSTEFFPPPLNFQQCFVDGELCLHKYYLYRRRRDDEFNDFKLKMKIFDLQKKRKFNEISDNDSSSCSKSYSRSVKKYKLLVRDDTGLLRSLTPTDTLWYQLYVKSSPQDDRLKKIFRTRFRVPYSYFLELSDMVMNHEIFTRWKNCDALGEKPSNIKLLLLGSLRYLGRSWTFDDINEANGISREVNRNFFSCFIEYGSTVMYKKYVVDVANSIDIANHESLFSMAGMNGCMGSSDATNVIMLSCPSWASNSHKGFKLNLPARTYNLTVSHSKVILCSTTGHPSTWNDKTIVLFDPLISGVHQGTKHQDFKFNLYEKNDKGEIKEVTYQGIWFMVDNGYLNWSCTIPPVKDASTYQTIRFSEWLESMRKDVECTFGILKQRFSILRYGIRLSSIKNVDKIWLTCCALHNKLIFIDGLDKNWDEQGNSTNVNDKSQQSSNKQPFSVSRLNRSLENYSADPSSIIDKSMLDPYVENGCRMVHKMPMDLFRQCLINHFDIRFKMNSVKWPKHFKNKPTSI